jgi:hypothetical protein
MDSRKAIHVQKKWERVRERERENRAIALEKPNYRRRKRRTRVVYLNSTFVLIFSGWFSFIELIFDTT